MICPQCGFVSFPGLDQCKKCGHRFSSREDQPPPLFRQTPPQDSAGTVAASLPQNGKELGELLGARADRSPDTAGRFLDAVKIGINGAAATDSSTAPDWQKELAERMQEFRRRRARISTGNEDEADRTIGPQIQSFAPDPSGREGQPNLLDFSEFDRINLQDDISEEPEPDLGALSLDAPRGEPDFQEEELGTGAGLFRRETAVQALPMEIELDTPASSVGVISRSGSSPVLRIASLSKRFVAGALDSMVLLSAAGVFALIFWKAAGRPVFEPVTLAAAGLIAIIFLLAYFGAFLVFASGTPGLLWTGLEVRTFDGNPPRRVDCYWRAFGYLVSASALLLGFIWALVDGEGLTWHDRMSRTLLVEAEDVQALLASTSS